MQRSRKRFSSSMAVFAAICWLSTTGAAQSVPDPAQLKQAAAESGNLVLGEIEAFHNTYLSDVTIQAPSFSADGSISGTSTFSGRDARVLLQYVESNTGMGRWILAAKMPTERLGDLVPAFHGPVTDQLRLATPILIFAKQATRINGSSLDGSVREFYAGVFGRGDFELNIHDGINLLTAASVEADIKAGTQLLGLNMERLVLQGSILKNFNAEELKQAKRDGKLLKAVARESELRALLTNLKIDGLPKAFQIRDLALLVTGEPTVGLEFYMTVGEGSDQRDFRCRAKFLMGNEQNKGQQGLSISATSDVDQPWQNALGIKGLEMRNLTMEIRYERTAAAAPPTVLVGVGGQMKFADKFVEVVGGVQSKAGVPVGFFKGSINSINRDDLVAVMNDAHTAATGRSGAIIDAQSLPDFELRNATLNFAPMGGSEELGIESGIGLKGELVLFGKPVGDVDVLGDANQPLLRMKANVNSFSIADIELRDAQLDVLMAGETESYFRFKGGARVMDIMASAEAELSIEKTYVRMSGKLANAFEADLVYRTPSLSNPNWEFEAGFKDDFSQKMGAQVATSIRDWAEQAKTDFDAAEADINKAKREVDKIDGDIARMRQQVESERREHKAALNRAQRDVQRIDRDIANMRRQVQSERDRHHGAIRSAEAEVNRLQSSINARRNAVKAQRDRDLAVHKRGMDTAKRNYDSAQRSFKSAESAWKKEKNPIKKIKKGVTKDAKGVARDAKKAIYYAAKGKYNAAKAAINRIPVDADPQIVGLLASHKTAGFAVRRAREAYQTITRGLSVDADPRIATLLAARQTASLAVSGAQRAFDLAHRIPVDADPRVAGLFVARDSAQTALDAAKLAVTTTGDTIQLASEVMAAAAAGEIIAIESIRLRGKVAVYEAGGAVELQANVRLLNKPQVVRVSVSAENLQSGDVFGMVAKRLIPNAS